MLRFFHFFQRIMIFFIHIKAQCLAIVRILLFQNYINNLEFINHLKAIIKIIIYFNPNTYYQTHKELIINFYKNYCSLFIL